ncbi:high-potential iron-sulfur protein [Lysobacter niabensis]|uniref:high-potential iron-sulfur protein n=1 Tax=Agrilutibacter niabensis TaxID=380628 RepID=UPI0036180FC1
MNIRDPGRRRFLGLTATIAVLPLVPGLPATAAPAKLPKLTDANPVAKGLGYSENAASVKHAMYKPGSTCANCAQFKPVAGDAAYGLCTLFPQNTVASKGWCSAWAKKA